MCGDIVSTLEEPFCHWKWQGSAVMELQRGAEAFLTEHFESAYLCTLHRKRRTLKIEDTALLLRPRQFRDRRIT
jgi:histone H3/H4